MGRSRRYTVAAGGEQPDQTDDDEVRAARARCLSRCLYEFTATHIAF